MQSNISQWSKAGLGSDRPGLRLSPSCVNLASIFSIINCGGGLVTKLCLTLSTPWTAAHQAPLSMGCSRQGYWSGLPFPSPGDLPDPKIEPRSPALQADSLPTELQGKLFNYNLRI